ncbi:MAG: hypothetical protein HC904_17445 [Blastochloris sp.]|nr:hypothetical protein [Blastochloris sp.]
MKNDLSKVNEQNLQKLLQLKRLETPGEVYFDAFLSEFHRYQRADLLKEPSLVERLRAKLEDLFFFEPSKAWAVGGLAVALVMLLSVGMVQWTGVDSGSSLANRVAPQSEAASALPVQLVSDSSFERDFSSPRYVTGQTPLAYDSALAF